MPSMQADLFASLAWRKALAEYIQDNLKWGKLSDVKSLTVYWTPQDGQAEAIYPSAHIRPSMAPLDDHSTTPTLLEETLQVIDGKNYVLCKVGDHTEDTVIRIKGNNEYELSKIALRLMPLMNPNTKTYGLKLNLGSLYYGVFCTISILSSGYVGIESTEIKQGIHMMDFSIRVVCPIVTVAVVDSLSGGFIVELPDEE